MFGGSFTHKLDEVGRFIMPRKFRASIGEPFIITRGAGCLLVMTQDRFHEISRQAKMLGDPLSVMFDPQARRLHHQLYSDMLETKCDAQGRVPLTNELRAYAGIDKDVVVIGVGEWIEIWAGDAWEEYRAENLTPKLIADAVVETKTRREGGDAGVSPTSSA